MLINNAGIMNVPLARTADEFESQAATNYLGPFALTNLLLPHITDRIVMVSSQLHRQGKVYVEDVAGEQRPYKAGNAYNDSKLAVVLFSAELQRRLSESGSPVRSLVAHPGIASTELATHSAAGKVTHALRFLSTTSSAAPCPSCSPPPRTCRATPTSDRTAWPGYAATRSSVRPQQPAWTRTPRGSSGTRQSS